MLDGATVYVPNLGMLLFANKPRSYMLSVSAIVMTGSTTHLFIVFFTLDCCF